MRTSRSMSRRPSQLLPTKRAGDLLAPAYSTTLPCFRPDLLSCRAECSRSNEKKISYRRAHERTKKPPCGKTWRLIVECCCLLGFADLLATYLRCRFVHFQVGLQAFHEEAVNHIAPINILSCDHSRVVVVQRDGALARACAGARNIERAKAALPIEQEAVINAASVEVISCDRPQSVVAFRERALACSRARARNIERAEGALVRPDEAVKHTFCVDEDSFDLPAWSEAYAECAVAGARGNVSARGIERGDGAVESAQEAVTHEVGIKVESCYLTRLIDGVGIGKYGAAGVELGNFTARSAHEAVLYRARVHVESGDRARRVDSSGSEF